MNETRFDRLADYSTRLHGHKYIFPVAVWLHENAGSSVVTQPEIRKGLIHAESNRIFEALKRLIQIGAMRELPPAGAPPRRFFEQSTSPYWDFVEVQLGQLETAPMKAEDSSA